MGRFTSRRRFRTVIVRGKAKRIKLLDNEKFGSFNPQVLGLGDISSRSKEVEAIAAVFDLSGFTNFCSKPDPQLAVPEYLSRFLDWLFNELKQQVVEKSYKEGKELWTDLPFLAKFLGDGVLFLWNTKNMSGFAMCNVVSSLWNTCLKYEREFYPEIKKAVTEPPSNLRCGVARGKVFSVGSGQDYVGPCINIASRLQKLSLLTFCVSRTGFDFEKYRAKETARNYVLKSVSLVGIGDKELVWVRKVEFDRLPTKEKKLLREL